MNPPLHPPSCPSPVTRLLAATGIALLIGGAGCTGRASGGPGEGPGDGPTCFVDFPCGGDTHCVGDRQFQRVRSYSCAEVCGDEPCSGGGCETVGPVEDCPEGTVCILDPHALFGGNTGSCGTPVDGGPGDGGPGADTEKPYYCVVDFPCSGPTECLNEREFRKVRTASCEETCGSDDPCSGASCESDGPVETCPEGTVCINEPEGNGSFGNSGACQALDGGPAPDAGPADGGPLDAGTPDA